MLIDGFTLFAQAINFLVLAWLLKRFLFKPILGAIDDREKRIADTVADADRKKKEALKEIEDFRHKNEDLDRQRAQLLRKAADDAQAERQRLLEDAKAAAETLRARRRDMLRDEERNLHQALGDSTLREVLAIARKALSDLAGTTLEERMTAVFLSRLAALGGEEKRALAASLKPDPSSPLVVRSMSDLAPALRQSIGEAVNSLAGRPVPVRFETAPRLICGIELAADGRKVAWSLADYMTGLERQVGDLLKDPSRREPPAAAAPRAEPPAGAV